MELEVSKKVREAIKAKLVELGCHVDDELPDYIMILIANRRSNQEIEGDLSLFLSDSTKKFVSWLSHVLKKLEQVTSSGPTEGSDSKDNEASANSANNKATTPKKKTLDKASKKIDKSKKEAEKRKKKRSSKEAKEELKLQISKSVKIDLKDKSDNKPSHKNTTIVLETLPLKQSRSSKYNSSKHEHDKKKENEELVDAVDSTVQKKLVPETKATVEESPVVPSETSQTIVNTSDSEDRSNLESTANTMDVQPVDDSQHDTLILDTGENEFADNLDELRRIALESQENKRKELAKKNTHQRKLIKDILMSQRKEDTPSSRPQQQFFSTRNSSRVLNLTAGSGSRHTMNARLSSPPRITDFRSSSSRVLKSPRRFDSKDFQRDESRTKSNSRTNRSPEKSVFSRIGPLATRNKRSRTRSRSRSPSPSPTRRLTSTIGTVISRASGDVPNHKSHSVNSVIKVADRPKRDLKMSNKMLLRAVADAQQSIIQKEQNVSKSLGSGARKRAQERDEITEISVVAKRRFSDFPEVISSDFYEPQEASVRRKSIKERLGVKRDIRRPVKERLGMIENRASDTTEENYDSDFLKAEDDYNILISVNDGNGNARGEKRNVMLASSDLDITKRISIQVNNSEEDDTSDDDSSTSSRESDRNERKASPTKKLRGAMMEHEHDNLNGIELSISDEDKLPEVPDGLHEYVEIVEEVEEIDEDSNQKDSFPGDLANAEGEEQQQLIQNTHSSGATGSVDSSQETNFEITINPASALKLKPITGLPDLRKQIHHKPNMNGMSSFETPSRTICKYWPKCQYKDKCVYEHPKCKFTPCKNAECVYKHAGITAHQELAPAKLVCKFYPKCTSMNCKFLHPSPCRFGVGCTDARCKNYHPGITLGIQKLKAKGVTLIPKVNQLKWVKK